MTDTIVTTVKSDPEIRGRLREEFKRLGLSIEDVAEASGIAKGTLDNIMSGRVESMKDVHLSHLCKAFPDLHITYVLTGDRKSDQQLTDDIRAAYEANDRALRRLEGR